MFPILYHEHHNIDNEDLPFWLNLASKNPGPILELGCGTGRVLIPLQEAGYNILGLDLDASMLAFLLNLAKKKGVKPPKIFQANCTRFRINTRFQLIIMPCNTFSTLSTTDRKNTLMTVKEHLQPGGIFVFCIPNPDYLKKLPRLTETEVEEIFPHPLDGEPVQVSSSWRRTATDFTIWWNYDHLLPDGTVNRTSAEIVHHLFTTETCMKELIECNLIPQKTLGDFKNNPHKVSSPFLIIQAVLS